MMPIMHGNSYAIGEEAAAVPCVVKRIRVLRVSGPLHLGAQVIW